MTLCDIGNTTFAFSHKGKKFKVGIDTKPKDLPKIKNIIYFISVNQKATNKFIKKYPKAINLNKYLKFKTSYQGMGIDRQIACHNITNGIVVDCGSAITVDIVKDGYHKGGFILVGIKKMIELYPSISKKLEFNFVKEINLDKIPLNTDEAISYAILKSIILPIQGCEQRYNLPLYFTGEDSKYIRKYFKKSKYKQNLIFTAMKTIIKNGRKIC